jgi:hypothetical protein
MSLFDRLPFMSLPVATVPAGFGRGLEIGDVIGTLRVNGHSTIVRPMVRATPCSVLNARLCTTTSSP